MLVINGGPLYTISQIINLRSFVGYLKEFQKEIAGHDFSKFMILWEEYCTSDHAPSTEMIELLKMIKTSEFAKPMGQVVEMLLPLAETITSPEEAYPIYKLMVDIQSTNSAKLATIALTHATRRHSSQPKFNELLRLVGLRSKENFQGALAALDLLVHLQEGHFVYHTGGWGVGEVMEVSFLRETVDIEFENAPGRKSVSFLNAMKTLIPLPNSHFLARRFGDADNLEKEAKQDPVKVLKMVLEDLGPQTASEIKDAMCELVIPEKEWGKWWSQARAKLKRDLTVESPDSLREPFRLREQDHSHEDEFLAVIGKKKTISDILAAAHSFSKEHPQQMKNKTVKTAFLNMHADLEKRSDLTPSQACELLLMKQALYPDLGPNDLGTYLAKAPNLVDIINGMEIQQFKKQAWMWVREKQKNWVELFLQALSGSQASLLREYLVKELASEKEGLKKLLLSLVHHPSSDPELFFWFFIRYVIQDKKDLPLDVSVEAWWESLLILLSQIEKSSTYADLVKKITVLITQDRYKEVRHIFKDADLDFTKEFLLLTSKCHSLGDLDQKSIRSLAAVKYPELAGASAKSADKGRHVIWTTEEAYRKIQERIRHIATVETIDNAKEIETARAHGDLRENAEYKFAKERRARLQGEMRRLSEEVSRARVITPPDVTEEEVGVGSIVDVEDEKGRVTTYKILGPWDADPEKHILSVHSKFAEAMLGLHEKDTFAFKEEKFKIKALRTIFSA